jgi:hypothetical protein
VRIYNDVNRFDLAENNEPDDVEKLRELSGGMK